MDLHHARLHFICLAGDIKWWHFLSFSAIYSLSKTCFSPADIAFKRCFALNAFSAFITHLASQHFSGKFSQSLFGFGRPKSFCLQSLPPHSSLLFTVLLKSLLNTTHPCAAPLLRKLTVYSCFVFPFTTNPWQFLSPHPTADHSCQSLLKLQLGCDKENKSALSPFPTSHLIFTLPPRHFFNLNWLWDSGMWSVSWW